MSTVAGSVRLGRLHLHASATTSLANDRAHPWSRGKRSLHRGDPLVYRPPPREEGGTLREFGGGAILRGSGAGCIEELLTVEQVFDQVLSEYVETVGRLHGLASP